MKNGILFALWLSIIVSFQNYALAASFLGDTYTQKESLQVNLRNLFTGPIALSVAIFGALSSGAILIFARTNFPLIVRSGFYLITAFAFLITADSLTTNFFEGAVVASDDAEIVDYIEEAYRRFEEKNENEHISGLYMHNELIKATV